MGIFACQRHAKSPLAPLFDSAVNCGSGFSFSHCRQVLEVVAGETKPGTSAGGDHLLSSVSAHYSR